MRKAEEVTWDMPEETFLRETAALFAERHPWMRAEDVRPKSIAREMFEGYLGFDDFVKEYTLARSEGLLLRYLSQVHNTLVKSVPREYRSDEVLEVVAFLRTLLRVDASLVDAWEDLLDPQPDAPRDEAAPVVFDLGKQTRALTARVRSELLSVVRALSREDFAEAATLLRPVQDFDATGLEEALRPYLEEYGEVLFTPEARRAHHTRLEPLRSRAWRVSQVLVDPAGDNLWALHGEVDLTQERDPQGPLVALHRIGP